MTTLLGQPLRAVPSITRARDTDPWSDLWRRRLQPAPIPSVSLTELVRPVLSAMVESQSVLDQSARRSDELSTEAGWSGVGFHWASVRCEAAIEVGLVDAQVMTAPRHMARTHLAVSARLIPTSLSELLRRSP